MSLTTFFCTEVFTYIVNMMKQSQASLILSFSNFFATFSIFWCHTEQIENWPFSAFKRINQGVIYYFRGYLKKTLYISIYDFNDCKKIIFFMENEIFSF